MRDERAMRRPRSRRSTPIALLALLLAATGGAEAPKADWNEDGIQWLGFEQGMSRIEATGRPGILVFYTDWCPHCTRYSAVFHDDEVVDLARDFVMIRVDRDVADAIDPAYSERGRYVPRTLFVDPRGEVDWTTAGAHPKYPYFLDTRDPGELASLMRGFRATHGPHVAAPGQGATAPGASNP
jgi:hypothetical protein